ncbi:MAG: PTS sugar transporter subunit IIA [Pseudomonadota bacterium]
MDLTDLLAPEGVIVPMKATCKKQALQELAEAAGQITGLEPRDIFDTLLQRERLGSTGLGRGIAIPHVKSRELGKIVCLFGRLDTAIDFDAHDGQPVDLIFLLLAPEHASGDHLKALARISRLVREPANLEHLRAASDVEAVRDALQGAMPASSHAA